MDRLMGHLWSPPIHLADGSSSCHAQRQSDHMRGRHAVQMIGLRRDAMSAILRTCQQGCHKAVPVILHASGWGSNGCSCKQGTGRHLHSTDGQGSPAAANFQHMLVCCDAGSRNQCIQLTLLSPLKAVTYTSKHKPCSFYAAITNTTCGTLDMQAFNQIATCSLVPISSLLQLPACAC